MGYHVETLPSCSTHTITPIDPHTACQLKRRNTLPQEVSTRKQGEPMIKSESIQGVPPIVDIPNLLAEGHR